MWMSHGISVGEVATLMSAIITLKIEKGLLEKRNSRSLIIERGRRLLFGT